jgi:hypothetical protein
MPRPAALLLIAAMALPPALAQAQTQTQARAGCFTYVSGDSGTGWGSITTVCPQVTRPRDPFRNRLR